MDNSGLWIAHRLVAVERSTVVQVAVCILDLSFTGIKDAVAAQALVREAMDQDVGAHGRRERVRARVRGTGWLLAQGKEIR